MKNQPTSSPDRYLGREFAVDLSEGSFVQRLLCLLQSFSDTSDKYHRIFLERLARERVVTPTVRKTNPCFKCKAHCCEGENIEGIPLYLMDVANFLDHQLDQYMVTYRHYRSYFASGLFLFRTPEKGYCDFVNRQNFMCRLQQMKPMYCFTWPYQFERQFKVLQISDYCRFKGMDFLSMENRLRFGEISLLTKKMIEMEYILCSNHGDSVEDELFGHWKKRGQRKAFRRLLRRKYIENDERAELARSASG
jgi:Fe-S-cluster containining protein